MRSQVVSSVMSSVTVTSLQRFYTRPISNLLHIYYLHVTLYCTCTRTGGSSPQ